MIQFDGLSLCSEATRERYERDRFAFDVAAGNLMESWRAVIRESYAKGEAADAQPSVTDT